MINSKKNVLAFRHPTEDVPSQEVATKLHPTVKRRRLLWLVVMSLFVVWAMVQLIVQQLRVWEREKMVEQQRAQLTAVKTQTEKLRKEIKQLGTDDYLLELAHKLGYKYPEEENYQVNLER